MVPSLQFLRRAGGLALAAALALSSAALAADTPALTAAERLEDLDLLCQSLERYHPDLFANTPEADFLARKAEIEGRLAGENDVEFALDLLSLTALAGDSHTQASLNAVADQVRFYPTALTWYDGHWYLTMAEAGQAALLGQEVTAVNGRSMEAVLEAFSTLLSADNPVKLRRQYRQNCNVADLYEFVGLVPEGGDLELTLGNGRTLSVEPVDAAALAGVSLARLSDQITAKPVTAAAEGFYWGTALDSDTYYIQYNACQEDPELPMETFAAQTETALDAGDYSRVLLDLRNNGGGSDGVIWPLLAVLRQEMDDGAEVVGLIGETTFSSAVINAVELQEMGAVLVGEPASGSVDHFGSVGRSPCPTPGSGWACPPSTSTWAPCWTRTPAGAWSLWSRMSRSPRRWRMNWPAGTAPWSGSSPTRRSWSGGAIPTPLSPGAGSWGCCTRPPDLRRSRRTPPSPTCWASSGICPPWAGLRTPALPPGPPRGPSPQPAPSPGRRPRCFWSAQ